MSEREREREGERERGRERKKETGDKVRRLNTLHKILDRLSRKNKSFVGYENLRKKFKLSWATPGNSAACYIL